jgi:glycosyltransferase involved in cell wall biosynthesis
MLKRKLAIVTSHPIQYNAPLFRLLKDRGNVDVKVFYTWGQTKEGMVYDPDFKQTFAWDIPLLEGYEKEFIENISTHPGAGHFSGIKNRSLLIRINEFQPDALLVYGWSFHSHLQVLRHFKGRIKILFRGDSTLLDETVGFSFRKQIRRIFLRWVYRYIDFALYTGEANKAYYLKHGLSATQLVYAPHAVDNDRFYYNNEQLNADALSWRRELGILDDELLFLFAGKLEPKKDPLLLLSAFQSAAKPKSRLLFVGNGILEEELKKTAFNNAAVLFLDFQNQLQMPLVYRLSNVFVLPSKGPGETWGLSVNEAMACGKPVIVSNKCGCAVDLITDNGFVFSAGNEQELSAILNNYINSPEIITTQSIASLNKIRHFSFEHIVNAIEKLV